MFSGYEVHAVTILVNLRVLCDAGLVSLQRVQKTVFSIEKRYPSLKRRKISLLQEDQQRNMTALHSQPVRHCVGDDTALTSPADQQISGWHNLVEFAQVACGQQLHVFRCVIHDQMSGSHSMNAKIVAQVFGNLREFPFLLQACPHT